MSSRTRLGLLLGVSLVFVAMGVVVTVIGDWRLGLGNVGFFGFAAAVFASQLSEFDKNGPGQLLSLRGGVPIVMSQRRRAFFIVVVAGVGASSMLIGYERNPMLWWIGIGLIATAVIVGGAALFKVPAPRSIMFSPEGVHFLGGPTGCLLHFDNLAQLQCAEWNGHLIVLLTPKNLGLLVLTVAEPKRAAAAKAFAQSIAYMRAPLTIWSSQFGLEANSLMKTIGYVREPAARAELKRVDQ